MRGIVICLCIILAAVAARAQPSAPEGEIRLVRTGAVLTPTAVLDRLAGVDVVIAGELHDNRLHHAIQAWLVRAVRPKGLAFEMIPEAAEEAIAAHLAEGGAPGEIGPLIGWDDLGWPDWALYRPIFEAAPGAVVTGGGVARRDLMAAIRQGAAAAARDPALAEILANPLQAAEQARLEVEMIAAHCDKLPAEAAPGMVEAQRLRDARFAAATLRALDTGRGPVVLITGNGHARTDHGVPVYLNALRPGLAVVSIGLIEMAPETMPTDAEIAEMPYDIVWLTPPEPREDPCLAFD